MVMKALKGACLLAATVALVMLTMVGGRVYRAIPAIQGAAASLNKVAVHVDQKVDGEDAALLQTHTAIQGAVGKAASGVSTVAENTGKVAGDIHLLQENGMGVLNRTSQNIDFRLKDSNKVLGSGILLLSNNISEIGASIESTATDVHGLVEESTDVVHQFNIALPLFLDCRYGLYGKPNPGCVYSQFAASSQAFKLTMGAWEKATPTFITHLTGMAQDMHTITSKYSAPRSFKAKLGEGAIDGVRVWAATKR